MKKIIFLLLLAASQNAFASWHHISNDTIRSDSVIIGDAEYTLDFSFVFNLIPRIVINKESKKICKSGHENIYPYGYITANNINVALSAACKKENLKQFFPIEIKDNDYIVNRLIISKSVTIGSVTFEGRDFSELYKELMSEKIKISDK